jgi:signal transduction histidine kinase
MMEFHPDPVREGRTAKRAAFAVFLAFLAAILPIYVFVFRLTATELLVALGPILLTLSALELVTRWESRMRRRHAYPHMLGYRLAAIHSFDRACDEAVRLLAQFLNPRAAVIAWLKEDGQELEPVAAFGMPERWPQYAPSITIAARSMREAVDRGRVISKPMTSGDPWFAAAHPRGEVTYVPLLSQDRPRGLLAIVTSGRNATMRDHRLLSSLAMVLALALDNTRLYEGERKSARRLQELNRMKSDFLITVSHELRTPLTSVRTAAEMLLEEEEKHDPEGVRVRLARSIAKGANRLAALVSELVDVSREDDFAPRLELEPQLAAELVTGPVALMNPLLAAKRQTLSVDIAEPEPTVLVDRRRFEQVVVNLLSNAHKHTPEGGHIDVRVSVDGGQVMLAFSDCGPGVPEEERELIFEPFYRGDGAGLGLGLAIAKSVVELHNGRIWVEANRDAPGSTFVVALPKHVVKSSRARAAAAAGA